MFYMITAEHMSTRLLEEAVTAVEDYSMGYVYGSGMDSMFTGFSNLLVQCTPQQAYEIQGMFYDQNNGAQVIVRAVEEAELEEYL